ncbi:hypothetical protein FMN63_26930 [Stappia sp. BW2]|nr:hypothetical protein FMN63_26930 [Stappia sp. BW2]
MTKLISALSKVFSVRSFHSLPPLVAVVSAVISPQAALAEVRNYLYTSAGAFSQTQSLLTNPELSGVQILYNWRMLEPEKGRYDFTAIERDLAIAEKYDKAFFLQLQDRFFSEDARYLPDYILEDPVYAGGLARQVDDSEAENPKPEGWVAVQWNEALRGRFQALLTALAENFDGRIEGLNLPESSMDIDRAKDKTEFTCDAYFDATLENMAFARSAFQKSQVVQYINFWPCEWANSEGYMQRSFEKAAELGIGLGGPDIVPNRKAQMKNSYPFFHQYQDKLPVIAMAIQEPTLQYVNPDTGKAFTRSEFVEYATGYLGVDIIFWSASAPWLQ